MEILLWLVPAAVATGVAMLAAGWTGRERHDDQSMSAPHVEGSDRPGVDETLVHRDEAVSTARPMRRTEPTRTEPTRTDVRTTAVEPAAPRRTA